MCEFTSLYDIYKTQWAEHIMPHYSVVELVEKISPYFKLVHAQSCIYVSCCLCIKFFLLEPNTSITVLSLFGKFFVTGAWQIMYIWTSECFPTTQRALLITIVGVFGRTGSITAPIMLDLVRAARKISCMYTNYLLWHHKCRDRRFFTCTTPHSMIPKLSYL